MQRLELPYTETARPYFATLANEPGAIWFHSGHPAREGHRWEWCSAWPETRYRMSASQQIQRSSQGKTELINPPDFLGWLATQQPESSIDTDLPFTSGLAGHLNYEAGYALHGLTGRHPSPTSLASIDRYDWSLVFDHLHQRAWLCLSEFISESLEQRLLTWHRAWREQPPTTPPEPAIPPLNWRSGMSREAYRQRFATLKEYILAGDIYQANLTRPWYADIAPEISDWSLYSHLIDRIQAPYAVYHRADDHTLMSVSPERFITINKGHITTQPIKGTRPRGATPEADQQLGWELEESEKDRAENLMIVDLLRNDLSRNARVGSVKVPELCKRVSFSNVHHLVSTITAELAANATPLDVLRDAFPGGSITGAPKRRAMEIIDELEMCARGPYCGTAFWLSDSGAFDSNILIRSLLKTPNQLMCSGGGGIVADSAVSDEYDESATKVAHILNALGRVSGR
ncbi:MAG: aminodeoxychorismate synthase component I [Saccharospirillum sp.]|uniref:aminodeoxychorismate synthase component I n=1 Tax=Saccharospirillum sp. TaxID=2033801 RepID=UPI00349FD500